MAEELQSLLEKIQKDGVEKADTEAQKIIDEANAKAKEIVADAEKDANERLEAAEKDAEQFEQRARKALSQAARDVVLSLGEAFNDTARKVIGKKVAETMSTEALAGIITDAVKAYFDASDKDAVSVVTSDAQADAIREQLSGLLAEELLKGVKVESESGIIGGFTISEKDNSIQHDFTQTAIADTLCQLLRPDLATIAREAAEKL